MTAGHPRPAPESTDRRQRLLAEFIAGAEEQSCKRTGRPMTAEEPGWVLPRYPGDA
jgi:hypothetical protein